MLGCAHAVSTRGVWRALLPPAGALQQAAVPALGDSFYTNPLTWHPRWTPDSDPQRGDTCGEDVHQFCTSCWFPITGEQLRLLTSLKPPELFSLRPDTGETPHSSQLTPSKPFVLMNRIIYSSPLRGLIRYQICISLDGHFFSFFPELVGWN